MWKQQNKYLFNTFSLLQQTGKATRHVFVLFFWRSFCLKKSWPQIWPPFLQRNTFELSSHVYQYSSIPRVFFDCQHLKHYSMTLLCSTIILSSSPLKFCVLCLYLITFVYNVFVIRNNIPAVSSFHCSYVNTLASDLYKALFFVPQKLFFYCLNGARCHMWRILQYAMMQWVHIRAFWIFCIQHNDLVLC